MCYLDDAQTSSLAIAEQGADADFHAQIFRPCGHIWEKVAENIWQCEICGDLADFGGYRECDG